MDKISAMCDGRGGEFLQKGTKVIKILKGTKVLILSSEKLL
jgi:hypothetical protein